MDNTPSIPATRPSFLLVGKAENRDKGLDRGSPCQISKTLTWHKLVAYKLSPVDFKNVYFCISL